MFCVELLVFITGLWDDTVGGVGYMEHTGRVTWVRQTDRLTD